MTSEIFPIAASVKKSRKDYKGFNHHQPRSALAKTNPLSNARRAQVVLNNYVVNLKMRRFWFEFSVLDPSELPPGLVMGCGVTAVDVEDAKHLIMQRVFKGETIPEISRFIEDVDLSELDERHILPNINPPIYRGIWFPVGYD